MSLRKRKISVDATSSPGEEVSTREQLKKAAKNTESFSMDGETVGAAATATGTIDLSVPVIDVSCFSDDYDSGDTSVTKEEEQAKVAKELFDACSRVGFFAVKGHGCAPDIQSKAFEALHALFDSEEKEKLNARNSSLFRGYNSVQTGAHACTRKGNNLPDLKESFTIGAEVGDSPMHGPNQWPSSKSLASFKPAMKTYWDTLLKTVAVRVMKALAKSLDLDDSFFLKECSNPGAQMVLLRYPGTDEQGIKERRGCGTHTDCGFLTILAQDDVEGLEVQRRDGTWMSVPPVPDAFVVNLGDMTARWTNDVFKSTPHRVKSTLDTRHSIPFFLNCNFETKVECLPGCGEPKYPPTEAGKYILEKLGLMAMMPASN